MRVVILDFYIHQIGSLYDEISYERLNSILTSGAIYSRKLLEQKGITIGLENKAFELQIPKEKECYYYQDDIHKDKVSLLGPYNHFAKILINQNNIKHLLVLNMII
jgi:hypothetical protein